jgi:hypothetical protein
MMGDIYWRAETAIAWLGDDFSNIDLAIKALNTLARVPFEKHKEMQNMSTAEYATYEALGVDVIDGKQVKCLTGFLGRRRVLFFHYSQGRPALISSSPRRCST